MKKEKFDFDRPSVSDLLDEDYIRENYMVIEYKISSYDYHKGLNRYSEKSDLIPTFELPKVNSRSKVLRLELNRKSYSKKPQFDHVSIIPTDSYRGFEDYMLRPVKDEDIEKLADKIEKYLNDLVSDVNDRVNQFEESSRALLRGDELIGSEA